jgi:toxin YoeB
LTQIKEYKKNHDSKSLKKIWELIFDIDVNGNMAGKGNPEHLIHGLKDYYSRRIDEINRLIYILKDGVIYICSCKGHYDIIKFTFKK